MQGATISPDLIDIIVKRLQSFTVGSLTIHKRQNRVVRIERILPETLDERGRITPG